MNNNVILSAVLLVMLTVNVHIGIAATSAVVTIDGNRHGPSTHKLIFGSNIQWEHNGDGLFDPATSKIRPEISNLINQLGITAMRYPGGTLSDSFNWRASIGPLKKRGFGKTYDGKLEKIYFGLDEFLQFCEIQKIEPVITVNFNIAPTEAAMLVQYINGDVTTTMGKLRAKNGHGRPYGVRYFEIGNEIYSHIEPGHCSVEAYAKKFIAMRDAMKSVDHSVEIGACCEICFQKALWAPSALPALLKWNSKLSKLAGSKIDFLSCHFYGPFDKSTDKALMHKTIFALPQLLARTLDDLKSLFPSTVKIAITEYNLGFGDKAPLDPMIAGYDSGLFTAAMLQTFLQQDIFLANHWSLINNAVFGMINSAPRLHLRPSWYIMKALSGAAKKYTLQAKVKSPVYNVNSFGSVPPMSNIPWVKAIVYASAPAKAGGKYQGSLSIILVNAHPDQHCDIAIKFQNFANNFAIRMAKVYKKDYAMHRLKGVKSEELSFATAHEVLNLKMPSASCAVIQVDIQDVAPKPPIHVNSKTDT